MHFVSESVDASLKVKAYSPMVAKIDLVTEGSHKNRAKLNHIPELELTKNQLHQPIIKGNSTKKRSDTRKDVHAQKGPSKKS